MEVKIKAGDTGQVASVDSRNRLKVDSVTRTENQEEAQLGNTYNFNTGDITLTSANESAVLYIKNAEESPIVITSFFYILGNTTGGSGDAVVNILKNPTGGTIVSEAKEPLIKFVNRNFSSGKTLSNSVGFKGDEGDTLTGGSDFLQTRLNSPAGRSFVDVGAIFLENGNSVGITFTPAAGNTSQIVQFAVSLYLRDR